MRAAATLPAELVSKVVLVTTDEDALSEFRQVLTPTLQTILVKGMEQMSGTLSQGPVDAAILDLDVIASSVAEAVVQLQKLRNAAEDLVIVALTRSRNRAERVKAQEAGADEFFVAPVDAQELRIVLERAIAKRRLEIEDRELREQLASKYTFGDLVGGCEAMQHVYDAITRVAGTNATVLLRGESGTGKELV